MTSLILVVFVVVYVGMILGRLPWLALDRTGIALLGAIVLVASGALSLTEAWHAIDVPTVGLLFGLMVVSAQFRLGGFYAAVTRRLSAAALSPSALLFAVILMTATLSAVFTNDIVCLAVAPFLAEGCTRRGLDPRPYLLALACAANVGSAATLIGNPQNILIGQALGLSFGGYLAQAVVPTLLGLGVVWAVIRVVYRGRWRMPVEASTVAPPPFSLWQTAKGLAVLLVLVAGFVGTSWPRELLALGAAGALLLSRRMHSRSMLGLVDWQLLVLFAGLFIVNEALARTGAMEAFVANLAEVGIRIHRPAWLFVITAVLSNLVSNVPAVMLLLPMATHPMAGPLLALSSTLAGNLIIVGSIANIIVVDQSAQMGVRIGWREHARVGAPVAIGTLAVAAAWLYFWSAVFSG